MKIGQYLVKLWARVTCLVFVYRTTSAVTLGEAYDGGGASPVGERGHAIVAAGGRLAAAAV